MKLFMFYVLWIDDNLNKEMREKKVKLETKEKKPIWLSPIIPSKIGKPTVFRYSKAGNKPGNPYNGSVTTLIGQKM